jgi:hypothetical protein
VRCGTGGATGYAWPRGRNLQKVMGTTWCSLLKNKKIPKKKTTQKIKKTPPNKLSAKGIFGFYDQTPLAEKPKEAQADN